MELFANANEFLTWVRADAFNIAIAIFVIGIIIRLMEILLLGRKKDLSLARGSEWGPGFKNIISRSIVDKGTFNRSPFIVIVGYIWHIGFFISLLFFVPHIELINATIGIKWPGLANPFVDMATVITMVSLIALLIHRLTHPVLRFISTFEDYFVWLLTFLPLLTGYIAYHRMIGPYPLALGLHILSVELLMVVFPFTKLMHAITLFIARWYSGAMTGRKGIDQAKLGDGS